MFQAEKNQRGQLPLQLVAHSVGLSNFVHLVTVSNATHICESSDGCSSRLPFYMSQGIVASEAADFPTPSSISALQLTILSAGDH